MSELSQKSIVIAVIDSGIDISVSGLSEYVLMQEGIRLNGEGSIIESEDIRIDNVHGTAVALAIRHICKNVKFLSFNILDRNLLSDARVLTYSLKKAIIDKPDIIHLSLGTTMWRHKSKLKKIINEAKKANIVVVAAANNEGYRSYPSHLKHVVGVKSTHLCNYNDYYYRGGFFYAPNEVKGINGICELQYGCSMTGNSMGAAFITGHIANILFKNRSYNYENILGILKQEANSFKHSDKR